MDGRTIEAYDQGAQRWLDTRYRSSDVELPAAVEFRELVGPGLIVDLGCGPGQLMGSLREPVVGVDASAAMLHLAGSFGRGPLMCGDAEALPLSDCSASGVWANFCLQHLPRDGFAAALREIYRVLRGNGWVEITMHNADETDGVRADDDMPVGRWFTYWKLDDLTPELQAAGFDDVEVVSLGFAHRTRGRRPSTMTTSRRNAARRDGRVRLEGAAARVDSHKGGRLDAAWPDAGWLVHPGVSSVGADLAALRHRMSKQSSLAVHASVDGLVFADLGGYDLPVRCQSVRKSLMSALIGIAIDRGMVALDTTIGELGLDDVEPLSDREKSATVRDLLMARSGIYHPAAYQENPNPLIPPRHTHRPGDRWVYNNWDFNALGTVLERVSGLSPFAAFAEWLARPLQMQDYDPDECEYAMNPVSHHPAYDFRISARDLARVGLLFLRRGRWRQTQLLPEAWIDDSTRPWSKADSGYEVLGAYGYMWWAGRLDDLDGRGFYAAIGGQGHALFVVPDHDMVLVHRNYGHLDVPKWPEVFAILRSVADLGDTLRAGT